MNDDTLAYRGAALQALSTLTRLSTSIEHGVRELSAVLHQARTAPESMLADPDSPINVLETLTATRAELATAREALEPFARAYSRKMEPLGDTAIPILVDPLRPDKTRSVQMSDFRRANQVFSSMSTGVDLIDRLRSITDLTAEMAQLLVTLVNTSSFSLSVGEQQTIRDLLNRFSKLISPPTGAAADAGPPLVAASSAENPDD